MSVGSWSGLMKAASGDVRRLSSVVRYSSIPVAVPENVAEHSFWVGLYAAMIHAELSMTTHEGGFASAKQEDRYVAQAAAVMSHALTHDLAECVTGDLVRTFKYSSNELKEAVDRAESKIVSELPKEVRMVYHVHRGMTPAPEDAAYVKAVVKAADFMSLQQYMVREWRRGNREIEPFYLRMMADLGEAAERLDQPVEKGRPKEGREQLASLYRAMLLDSEVARER